VNKKYYDFYDKDCHEILLGSWFRDKEKKKQSISKRRTGRGQVKHVWWKIAIKDDYNKRLHLMKK